jgi:hypothetical protein
MAPAAAVPPNGFTLCRFLIVIAANINTATRLLARDQGFTAHVARFRAQVMLSTAISAVGFVQYSHTDNAVIGNVRLRFNPREGNDLYLVWNEGLVTDRTSFDPVRPLSTERTLVVKYSHTFQLGL